MNAAVTALFRRYEHDLRFARALVGMNLRASLALRASFCLQAAFMFLNNLFFFSMWLIFFNRFSDVRGWHLGDMTVLFGVVAAGYGLSSVFAGGTRDLARMIVNGELDPLLAQPKSPLLQAVGSRSLASGWGDMATGAMFLGIAVYAHPAALPVAVVAVLCSATVFTASRVFFHSLAFWLGRMETLATQLWEFQITFGMYPASLFSGLLKLFLFTVIPAGFVAYLPADLVRTPGWLLAGALLAGTAAYSAFAFVVFHRGLRWYESGNRFGGVW
jgi:ABC-2 type transport system permease protein